MQPNTASQHHLLSVSDYYTMAKSGIFKDDERVELINGEIFDMSPIGSFHADCVDRLTRLLFKHVDDTVRVRIQNPIFLSDFSEPEPDIALVKDADYSQNHPAVEDVLLVIEVADSSLHYDRNTKLPLYARCGLPEIWLIDTNKKELNIYQQPFETGYQSHYRPKVGELVQPLLIKSVTVDWHSLFVY